MRPATLYYLRLEFPSTIDTSVKGMEVRNELRQGQTLYKLGYTTTTLHERVYGHKGTYRYRKGKRICLRPAHNGMGLPPGTMVYVISTLNHRNGALVLAWEQYLHNKYATQRYCGSPVMGNGNTELYVGDILNLDY